MDITAGLRKRVRYSLLTISKYLETFGRFANLSAPMTARKNYHIKCVILGSGKWNPDVDLVENHLLEQVI